MKKVYVIDTNILMESPEAIFGFDDNVVVITNTVLQELDKHKRDIGEPGYNARTAIRTLEAMVTPSEDATNEYKLPNKGTLVIYHDGKESHLPGNYNLSIPDNQILNDIMSLKGKYLNKNNQVMPTILVTNDVSMRLNARSIGIEAQAYKNVRLETEETYTGRAVLDCNNKRGKAIIKELKANGKIKATADEDSLYYENEYVLMQSEDEQLITQYRDGQFTFVDPSKYRPMGISPRNAAQIMALHALMAPVEEVPLVILEGPAGTSKTFLATAAGLDQTIRYGKSPSIYSHMIITRNNVLADEDHGYLPGTLDEKMFPLLAPFYDNMESLFRQGARDEDPLTIRMQIDDLFESGIVEATSMAYIRGRSLSDMYLILDECQNTTQNQMFTYLTRPGEKCKVIIAGCTNQIDNPRLDKRNNGLTFAIERFKESGLAAQVTFTDEECVRSPLAAEASRLLGKQNVLMSKSNCI